jgi:two-component system, OmpR family, manganese sensing sensor histidine kinase
VIQLRRFTAWVTASKLAHKQTPPVLSWRWQLLLGYLAIMATILSTSALIVYVFFSESLVQQSKKQLLTLAQAAAPSLGMVKNQGRSSLDKELPWRELFSTAEQSLEWFDPNAKPLSREGQKFPTHSLLHNLSPLQLQQGDPIFDRQGNLLIVTLAIYTENPQTKTLRLTGYIRASESTLQLDNTLSQFRLGLGVGGSVALVLISLSSVYLTQRATDPMRQNFQRLKQFTTDVSHELKNPLTRISLATELMLSMTGRVIPGDSRELDIIAKATDQMQRLIEDLLFLARTEAAPDHRQASWQGLVISLDDLLRTLAAQFELQAQRKKITFQTKISSELSIRGDAHQLKRLFTNLLENALKYTEGGGRVTVAMEQLQRNVVVFIEDTGIGIPSEYQPLVFQRFLRSDQPQVQQEEGLGLGLAIAQAIAKQHGGEIQVSSQMGVGSTFRVLLPLL